MTRAACPSQQDLSAYVLGQLPDDVLQRIADHTQACPPCQETLSSLDRLADPLIAGLRQARAATVAEPEVQKLLRQAEGLNLRAPGPPARSRAR